ncbi:MAG: CvpA family protein [Proteobacteria bacterium]|nr:CvpA family protein [Desulfobacteraceae bacterium]MBU3979749.1 CvpA family protein [Pseudomonadota bacterium]MBU4101967.1 CvpA family protein [Pseudomonadota bacterium]MBU4127477.1 CvpA family protein [Pseudomonadota bacterium]
MNLFDILIVIIFGFCLIRGFFRGFIKEASSIIGVLGGFYAAYSYYMEFAKPLSGWISDKSYLYIVSFLIVFCGVFLIVSILGVVIKYILNIAFLGWVDRICGAGFGIIKAVLIASVLLIVLTAFLPGGAPIVKDSMLSPHVSVISEKMAKVIPKDMKDQFVSKIEELKKAWKKSS